MTRKRVERRTITTGVSFSPELWNRVQFIQNRSEWINKACEEKLKRETSKEGKIKILQQQKRELAKKMQIIDEQMELLEDDL